MEKYSTFIDWRLNIVKNVNSFQVDLQIQNNPN